MNRTKKASIFDYIAQYNNVIFAKEKMVIIMIVIMVMMAMMIMIKLYFF